MHFAKDWSYNEEVLLPTKILCLVNTVNMKKKATFSYCPRKLFAAFMEENKLKYVNSMGLTEGVNTRIRSCLDKIERSTIDFYVVCKRVVPFITSMKIDNGNKHTLRMEEKQKSQTINR